MFYGDGGGMAGMHGLWWIFWVLFIGLLVFYAWRRPSGRQPPARETPHQVLQRRLASGEIAPEDYERRKALLDRDQDRAPPT